MKHIVKKENRINKALQDLGIFSRREADKKIEAGLIFINGKRVNLGQVVKEKDVLEIKGEIKELKYLIYYKPRGEVTGESQKEKLVGLHPVGRLDKESEGLLIYTNDHSIVDLMLNPKNKIQKEYKVKIREKATPRVERILLSGITTQEASYEPVENFRMSEDCLTLYITLVEGKKHEVRRMLNALNLTIVSLTRTRIERFKIQNMKSGQIKDLSKEDFNNIKAVQPVI